MRFDVFLVPLDPVVGSELRKTRPCVVVSPDELNDYLRTVLVAPLTTGGRTYSTRVACSIQGKEGHVALDHSALSINRGLGDFSATHRTGRFGGSSRAAGDVRPMTVDLSCMVHLRRSCLQH